jgi:N-hydroxyarylamine O-acetyltransferase
VLDLDAYLARIGLSGRPSLLDVHRAHATSIPFENLDPRGGRPVSLALEDLERKLVAERRGGYCFEQNLLLRAALEELGAEVELHLARVRFGATPGVTRPRSHLLLHVRSEHESWHADVGFGMGTLLDPLPFGPGGQHRQAGWSFRIVTDGPELVLQESDGGDWIDLYGFLELPVPEIDVETINWWTCTHPRSPFVSGLIVSCQDGEGTRTTLSDWNGLTLREQTSARTEERPVQPAEVPGLLKSRFGLSGFAVDAWSLSRRSGPR